MRFSITIEKDEEGRYVVECTDLPGCLAEGDTVEEAIRNINEAIVGCLKSKLNVDYDIAKKEVMERFQERGEAYPSDIEEDLELDYKLICQIVDELKREGRLEVL